MEDYLPRCLDSVTREDVPDTLEVIVVNDGSKDRSLEIAKEYQAKRPDIISIIDKPNGHYGSCINAALKVATGKYFRPLDADDWFDTDALIHFLSFLSETNDDLVITSFCNHRKTKEILCSPYQIIFNQTYLASNKTVIKKQDASIFTMHSSTFKLEAIRKANIKLPEKINYTDAEFVFKTLRQVNTFSFFDAVLYHYDLTREGQSVNITVASKTHSQLAFLVKRMLEYKGPLTALEQKVLCYYLRNYYYRLLFYCKNDAELKEIDSIILSKDKVLKKSLDKSLLYASTLWRIFGIHFFWYEPLKRFFHIDR